MKFKNVTGKLWNHPRKVLGHSRVTQKCSRKVQRSSWKVLGSSRQILRRSWIVLGPSCNFLKYSQFQTFWIVLRNILDSTGTFSGSLRTFPGIMVPFRVPLEPPQEVLKDIGRVLGPSRNVLETFIRHFETFRGILELFMRAQRPTCDVLDYSREVLDLHEHFKTFRGSTSISMGHFRTLRYSRIVLRYSQELLEPSREVLGSGNSVTLCGILRHLEKFFPAILGPSRIVRKLSRGVLVLYWEIIEAFREVLGPSR